MALHAKSCSKWQNKDPSNTVVATWLKYKITTVTVLSSLMKLGVAIKIAYDDLAMPCKEKVLWSTDGFTEEVESQL
jgi:hypothetical protein